MDLARYLVDAVVIEHRSLRTVARVLSTDNGSDYPTKRYQGLNRENNYAPQGSHRPR